MKIEFQIIKIARGIETVVASGSRTKMNNRLKQLRASTKNGISGRGKKYPVEYVLKEVRIN